ncbi:uncharacterized protein PAC_13768 [Phialocephala subalpina]|uniref:F-box domain-containing protein n=1 Tax=Phialocephala subalpina TaxID=576137 RepID=A0A1L7XFR6_9HELO|nr:uncharacterized protein PAC_13768 [Phialocephala subalpina]
MSKAMESRLLALADELLLKVIEHIEPKDDLSNLSRVCSRLQAFAEPFLYQSILIRKGEHATQLCYALHRRTARAYSVRKLQVAYMHKHRVGIEVLNQALRTMCSLQEINIESPCCNDTHPNTIDFESKGRINYAEYFQFASSMTLESPPRVQVPLQTLILHSHDNEGPGREAFNMGSNAVIFLHPTLRNLTISCFDIGEDIGEYLSATQKSSPLKTLTFVECNINVTALSAILYVPKSLERLTLGERIFHLDQTHFNTSLGRSLVLLLQALASQKDSLQYFKHICHVDWEEIELPESNSGIFSMVEQSRLTEMELGEHSIFCKILRQSTPPWTTAAPPNLRVLRLLRSSIGWQPERASRELEHLYSMAGCLDHLDQLDYILDPYGRTTSATIIQDLWRKESTRSGIINLVESFSKRDIKRLRIFAMNNVGQNIPPYMYGEIVPEEMLAYDSTFPHLFGDVITPMIAVPLA